MKVISLSNISKKVLALGFIGLSILSPLNILAVEQPVSAPITIPVPVPAPSTSPSPVPSPIPTATPSATPSATPIPMPEAPEMVYPRNGQTLDLEGAYMFKVRPVAGATGYLFGLFQNGQMVFENYRDNRALNPDGMLTIRQNDPAHARFQAGPVRVMVRAMVNKQWTDAREITITLKARKVQPQILSIWPTRLQLGRIFIIFGKNFGNQGGKINFYHPGSTAASGSATNIYWSDSMIVGRTPRYIRGNRAYQIQVRTPNSDSPLIYRYIAR